MKITTTSNSEPERFVSCRVGLEVSEYHEDLKQLSDGNHIYGLKKRETEEPKHISKCKGNFILVPITSPRSKYYYGFGNDCRLLPYLVQPKYNFESEVAVSISLPPQDLENLQQSLQVVDKLIRHALYLPIREIVINMLATRQSRKALAGIICINC